MSKSYDDLDEIPVDLDESLTHLDHRAFDLAKATFYIDRRFIDFASWTFDRAEPPLTVAKCPGDQTGWPDRSNDRTDYVTKKVILVDEGPSISTRRHFLELTRPSL